MTSQHRLPLEVLQQYVDDELDAEHEQAVARHLRENAEDRSIVEAYCLQLEWLQQRYGAVLQEPIPERLRVVRREVGYRVGR